MSVLNEAKLNLKNSLNRLEKAIDVKIQQLAEERELFSKKQEELLEMANHNQAAAELPEYQNTLSENTQMIEQLSSEIKKLSAELSDKVDEIEYLREQNVELSGNLGKQSEKNNHLQNLLDDTKSKVDFVITEIRQHLTVNQG